jgi:hypothetical protein
MNIKFIIYFFPFLFSLFVPENAQGQITIGSGREPAKGALLDLKENEAPDGNITSTKGIIFPRVNLISLTSLEPLLSATEAADITQKTIHRGIIVYNIKVSMADNLQEGLYCWDETKWVRILGNTNDAWLTQGNAETDTIKNFIGTTDNVPLIFKVDSKRAGYLSNTDGFANYTAFGLKALSVGNKGEANVAFGYQALLNNTTGGGNTAVGLNALAANINGSNNTAVGNRALANSIGTGNTAVGSTSMTADFMTGSGNTGVGQDALHFLTSGGNNTAVGTRALINNITANSNVAVGNNALQANILGNNNTAVGTYSLGELGDGGASSGENNTAVGSGAGGVLTLGSNNIFIGVNANMKDSISNQMNIGNTIFGTGMNGSLALPAGNIGIRTNNPAQPFHVNSLVGGVKTPIRFEGLPDTPAGTTINPLIVDSVGNVYQDSPSVTGQVLRHVIKVATYGNAESPLKLDTLTIAPNGAKNNFSTIPGSGIVFNQTLAAGNDTPARTTDRILLPPGIYQVTVRLLGKFNGTASDNAVYIKAIVGNNEYSLANQVTASGDDVTFYYIDVIDIEGTASQYIDFTAQTVKGRTNTFTTKSSIASSGGGSGASARSIVLIQRLR